MEGNKVDAALLLFVIGGIFMLDRPNTSAVMAWSCILFFGLSYPLGIFQLLDRRPQIIINELGIFDRMSHRDFINWEIIQDAYLAHVHGQVVICLVVNQQFEPSRTKSKLKKKVAGLSKALGFQELNISLANVKVDAVRLTEFIVAMRTADRPTQNALIKQALPDQTWNA